MSNLLSSVDPVLYCDTNSQQVVVRFSLYALRHDLFPLYFELNNAGEQFN
jgi:hypothetical protein